MKKFRCLGILMIALLITGLFSPKVQAAVKINKSNATIYVNDTIKLKITGTKKTVKWSSSDKTIATVSNKGKVTGISAGDVTITANVSGHKYTCKVKVTYDIETMIQESYDWMVNQVWNDNLSDIKRYNSYGTDACGSPISKSDIKNKLKNLDDAMSKEDYYKDFYSWLSGKKYKELKEIWNELITELDHMYDVVKNSDITPNSEIDYKYDDDFGLQLYDFLDLAY